MPESDSLSSLRSRDSIFFPVGISQKEQGSAQVRFFACHSPGGARIHTIVFISLSVAQCKRQADWAEAGADGIVRCCPVCLQDSVVGHGRRQKQAHDQDHDWIKIRRGLCNLCGKTITFLPVFSLPYTHYSLIARSEALRRYFVDGAGWEAAAPLLKDSHRVADPSTLRRWFRDLDCSQPVFSFLRRTIETIDHCMRCGQLWQHGDLTLSWPTVLRPWYLTNALAVDPTDSNIVYAARMSAYSRAWTAERTGPL